MIFSDTLVEDGNHARTQKTCTPRSNITDAKFNITNFSFCRSLKTILHLMRIVHYQLPTVGERTLWLHGIYVLFFVVWLFSNALLTAYISANSSRCSLLLYLSGSCFERLLETSKGTLVMNPRCNSAAQAHPIPARCAKHQ